MNTDRHGFFTEANKGTERRIEKPKPSTRARRGLRCTLLLIHPIFCFSLPNSKTIITAPGGPAYKVVAPVKDLGALPQLRPCDASADAAGIKGAAEGWIFRSARNLDAQCAKASLS